MKRKNLILSLICSIALTIGLVAFTVVSVWPKNDANSNDINKDNVSDVTDTQEPTVDVNEGRDGSAENPYIITDAENFLKLVEGSYLDENGEYVDYNAKDEEGNLVYPALSEGLNFELAGNIDFANVDVGSIFNKGVAFNGKIDGKDFALQNITIEVTKENLGEFMYREEGKGYRAHIALFGKLDSATIVNLGIENVNVVISSEILDYLNDVETTFVADYEDVMFEVVVGTLAGLAFDSTIDANVTGKVNAFSYVFRNDEQLTGCNAIGGLVGSAVDTDISNSTVDVDMTLAGNSYFAGGLVGKAYNVTANAVKSDLAVSAKYEQNIYVGGAYGYAAGLEMDGAEINLAVSESGERLASEVTKLLSEEKVDTTINTAGIVAYIRANDEAQKVAIKNVNVNANVAIDGVYAGAWIEIWSTAEETVKTVFVENVSLVSNVDVLKAYGIAKDIINTEIKTKLALEQAGYDITLTGKVNFDEKAFYMIAKYVDDATSTFGDNGYKNLTIKMDETLKANLSIAERAQCKILEIAKRIDYITADEEVAA